MSYSISKPAQATEGFHGILYGKPKTGKTSTMDDPKLKVLLLDMEGGSAVLSEASNIDMISIPDYETLLAVGKDIESGKLIGYDMVALDSFTRFEDLVKEYIATKYAVNRRRGETKKFGDSAMQDWGDLQFLISKTVKWFHSLTKRGDNSIHVMWIAHVLEDKDEVTSKVVGTKVALQGSKTPEIVTSVVDGLFYMYNRQVQEEGGKVHIERGILTKAAGIYNAATRQSKKRDPLPDKIVSPVWSEIFEQLGYTRT